MVMRSSHISSRYFIIVSFSLVWVFSSVLADDMDHQSENGVKSSHLLTSDVSQGVAVVKKIMRNIGGYLADIDSIKPAQPKCLKIQCRIICFNGKESEIAKDISIAMSQSEENAAECTIISELHLFNYKFVDDVLPVGFLSTYTDKVRQLYIGISNITRIENGAFGNGKFTRIILEGLRLQMLDKTFFTNISEDFQGISIMQDNEHLQIVYPDFLEHVQFQIKYLKLQTGINCVRNITAVEPTLGSLNYADFSYNNFSNRLLEDTFRKLTMVENLVLSNSNIEYLPNYIFQDMKYLEYLDISHNKLITLTKSIFGITQISSNLRIYAGYNNWHCDCGLQQEMNKIPIQHSSKFEMFCMTPDQYQNMLLFDERICEENDEETVAPPNLTTVTAENNTTSISTSTTVTTTTESFIFTISTPTPVYPNETVPLQCVSTSNPSTDNGTNSQNIKWPQLHFIPKVFGALTVKITVQQKASSSTFGLFWFCKTTKEYYMMELLPDEFGLGCYFTMPLQTMVTNLMPNLAYTFCLVDDEHNFISPFSCKSVHISGNLNTHYNAWLSKNVRTKGISLMVLGTIIFMFIGIMSVFLVLKHKPVWLKGSKRIIKSKSSSNEIVILPRKNTAEYLKYKEDIISRMNNQEFPSIITRNNSTNSLTSSDSYMNANLYEIIPAYITFDKVPQTYAPSQPEFEIFDTSWNSSITDNSSVRYAQITPRTKRISSDPLPALPTEVFDVPN